MAIYSHWHKINSFSGDLWEKTMQLPAEMDHFSKQTFINWLLQQIRICFTEFIYFNKAMFYEFHKFYWSHKKVIAFVSFYSNFGSILPLVYDVLFVKQGATEKFKSYCNVLDIHRNLFFSHPYAKYKYHFVVFPFVQIILDHLQHNSLCYDVCVILKISFPFLFLSLIIIHFTSCSPALLPVNPPPILPLISHPLLLWESGGSPCLSPLPWPIKSLWD